MSNDLLQDLLYSNKNDKINAISSNEIENEFEDSLQNGWSQSQVSWVSAVSRELASVAAFDPRPVADGGGSQSPAIANGSNHH